MCSPPQAKGRGSTCLWQHSQSLQVQIRSTSRILAAASLPDQGRRGQMSTLGATLPSNQVLFYAAYLSYILLNPAPLPPAALSWCNRRRLFCAFCSGRVSTWTGVADAGRVAGAISGQQHHRPQPPRRWRMHCRLKPQRRQVGHVTVLTILLHQELDVILHMCLRLRFSAASLGLEHHMLQAVE